MKAILYILCLVLLIFTANCGNSLQNAVDKGDIKTVQSALANDPGLIHAYCINDSYTLLHYAARSGNVPMTEFLLEKGARINSRLRNHTGLTPLLLASDAGHLDIVRLLVEKGADLHASGRGGFMYVHALGLAARSGHIDVAEFLIEKGITVDYKKKYARPLNLAAKYGRIEMIDFLVKKGAQVNLPLEEEWSALHAAVYNRQTASVKKLVALGADVNKISPWKKPPLHLITYWKRPKPEIVRILVENGADLKIRDGHGATALQIAVFNGFKICTSILLENGAPVYKNKKGKKYSLVGRAGLSAPQNTANVMLSLHRAAAKGDLKAIKIYMKKYPQLINAGDETGRTPLHWAVVNNHLEAAGLLIAGGADVNAAAFLRRVEMLHGVMARLMVPRLGRVKWKKDRKTPLDFALKNKNKQMVLLLKEKGAVE